MTTRTTRRRHSGAGRNPGVSKRVDVWRMEKVLDAASRHKSTHSKETDYWIPAFAGMTAEWGATGKTAG